ncbi:hypothetical protein ACFVW2_11325 [Streptomyces sp. NPDC058171]
MSLGSLSLVGCSDPGSGGTADGARPPAATRQATALVFPIDSYQLSESDRNTVSEAVDILIRDCMKQSGHDWRVVRAPQQEVNWMNRLRYGVIEIEVAKTYGYRTSAELLFSDESRQFRADIKERRSELTKSEWETSWKCRQEADAHIDRGVNVQQTNYQKFRKQSYEGAQRDPDVVRAVAEWRSCMKDAGFPYASPDAAAEDPRWRQEEGEPSTYRAPEEIATAVADVTCKNKVRLVDRRFAAEKAHGQRIIDGNAAYFSELRVARERQLTRARDVIDGDGTKG